MAIVLEKKNAGRPNLYEKVKKDITAAIELMKPSSQRKLESEKALCERLGVSRPVIRRALKELAEAGIISSIPGRGHFVTDKDSAQESGVITVIIGATDSHHGLDDPHIVKILQGIETELSYSKFRMIWEPIGTNSYFHKGISKPHIENLKGAILVPLGHQTGQEMSQTLPTNTKYVIIGRPSWSEDVPSVQADHDAGSRLAVKYFIQNRHKVIGCIGVSEDHPIFSQRLIAFKDELAKCGLVNNSELTALCPIASFEYAEQAIVKMIRTNPDMTAVLVSCVRLLPACLSALQSEKKRVPDDISIICFDSSAMSWANVPFMPEIRQPSEEMGSLAAKMLLRLLDGEKINENNLMLSTELVIKSKNLINVRK